MYVVFEGASQWVVPLNKFLELFGLKVPIDLLAMGVAGMGVAKSTSQKGRLFNLDM